MATFTKVLLSGSTNGKPILVTASASTGTAIHTAVTGTTSYDEIWLWVTNTDTSARTLTIEYGGTTDPGLLVCKAVSIPLSSGPILVIPGLLLQNALAVTAFTDVGSKVLLTGYVNRIS